MATPIAMIASAVALPIACHRRMTLSRIIDEHTRDGPHERRFARTVGADNGDGFPSLRSISTPNSAWKSP
jgi:hypothetical protein